MPGLMREAAPADTHSMLVLFNHLDPARSRSPMPGLFEQLAGAARDEGVRVVDLPWRELAVAAQDALGYLDAPGGWGLLNGGVVAREWYEDLELAAASRGVRMVNGAAANEQAMRFERFYPLIEDLTARSVVLEDGETLDALPDGMRYPVFVKASVASAKHLGLDACVARNDAQLADHLARAGVRVVREWMDLRQLGGSHNGMPITREWRTYLLDGRVLGRGFYWADADPSGPLSPADQAEVDGLCQLVCSRLDARLVSVDAGQLADGSWRVIEVGDVQHTGVGQMAHHIYWRKLALRLSDCSVRA